MFKSSVRSFETGLIQVSNHWRQVSTHLRSAMYVDRPEKQQFYHIHPADWFISYCTSTISVCCWHPFMWCFMRHVLHFKLRKVNKMDTFIKATKNCSELRTTVNISWQAHSECIWRWACVHIHGSQRVNPSDFGFDFLSFSFVPQMMCLFPHMNHLLLVFCTELAQSGVILGGNTLESENQPQHSHVFRLCKNELREH